MIPLCDLCRQGRIVAEAYDPQDDATFAEVCDSCIPTVKRLGWVVETYPSS